MSILKPSASVTLPWRYCHVRIMNFLEPDRSTLFCISSRSKEQPILIACLIELFEQLLAQFYHVVSDVSCEVLRPSTSPLCLWGFYSLLRFCTSQFLVYDHALFIFFFLWICKGHDLSLKLTCLTLSVFSLDQCMRSQVRIPRVDRQYECDR